MSEYTINLNGSVYELSQEFRDAIAERARLEYQNNQTFDCWWTRAEQENYANSDWSENVHQEGDPILVIETTGATVPWDDLDQLQHGLPELQGGERSFFPVVPEYYDAVPTPEEDDESKIPQKPEKLDDVSLVAWIPEDPEMYHTWSTGEAIIEMDSWVEWNIQARADQPTDNKPNTHDRFESLCMLYGCEKVGEYTKKNIPKRESGSVKRKGCEAFEEGRFGGNNWNL